MNITISKRSVSWALILTLLTSLPAYASQTKTNTTPTNAPSFTISTKDYNLDSGSYYLWVAANSNGIIETNYNNTVYVWVEGQKQPITANIQDGLGQISTNTPGPSFRYSCYNF